MSKVQGKLASSGSTTALERLSLREYQLNMKIDWESQQVRWGINNYECFGPLPSFPFFLVSCCCKVNGFIEITYIR